MSSLCTLEIGISRSPNCEDRTQVFTLFIIAKSCLWSPLWEDLIQIRKFLGNLLRFIKMPASFDFLKIRLLAYFDRLTWTLLSISLIFWLSLLRSTVTRLVYKATRMYIPVSVKLNIKVKSKKKLEWLYLKGLNEATRPPRAVAVDHWWVKCTMSSLISRFYPGQSKAWLKNGSCCTFQSTKRFEQYLQYWLCPYCKHLKDAFLFLL